MKARRQRCTADLTDGSRKCTRWAINGGTVCPKHGGSAPQVRLKAKERLNELVLPAIGILGKAIKKAEKRPDVDNMKVAIKSAGMILDRTGYAAKQEVELSGNVGLESSIDLSTFPLWLRMLMAIYSSSLGLVISTELEKAIEAEINPLFLAMPMLGEPLNPPVEMEKVIGEGEETEEEDGEEGEDDDEEDEEEVVREKVKRNGRSNNGKRLHPSTSFVRSLIIDADEL